MDYNECAISSGAKRGLVRTVIQQVIPKLREGIPLPCSIAETRVFID
jgi:hypothetical protein